MFKYLISIIVLVFLTGCWCTVPVKPVVEVTTIFIQPSDDLLADCVSSAPPNIKAYVKMSYPEKEDALTKYSAEQTYNLLDCNKNIHALKEWYVKQAAIYKDKPNEVK